MSRLLKISAIIVNWNGMKFLPTCLDSLAKQSYKNLEIIVVDCVSKDNSVPWIVRNYPKVKIISLQKDPGPAAAINLATRGAKGEYTLILNNDVILPENLIEKMAKELSKDENCVVTPVELDWKGNYIHSGIPDHTIGIYLYPFIKIKGDMPFYPSTACCMTTKEIMSKFPLNESFFLYEDTEWGIRLHLSQIKIKALKDIYFLHKVAGTSSELSVKQSFYMGKVRFATYYICLSLLGMLCITPILMLDFMRHILRYIKRKKIKSLVAYLGGWKDFIVNFETHSKNRKTVQGQKMISDWALFKIMLRSINYEENAKREWMNNNKNETFCLSEIKSIKEEVVC
jgi:GT2 family glycosyltransferase